MIHVGIDDTDTEDSRGTNQLAKAMIAALADQWSCRWIVRHQLLDDPRVPYTSRNGSASIALEPKTSTAFPGVLFDRCRRVMMDDLIEGSDPGLCVAESVPQQIVDFGLRCQREIVNQHDARALAKRHGLRLEGLGGTEDGVIGALAAVGLAETGNDGRVVQLGNDPIEVSGMASVAALKAKGVAVRTMDCHCDVTKGVVDVGKKLRPNRREHQTVLFVRALNSRGPIPVYEALKLP